MIEHALIQDLAIIMVVAGLATVLFRRIGQPVVLGYILAGLIIGPHTPPYGFVSDIHTVETLAEMGVMFLMFSLGMHFNLKKLASVGTTATSAAFLEVVLMLIAGYAAGQAFGWSTMDSIFLGAILSISSTTIIIKALEDLKLTNERFAQITFGTLIVEDIVAILLLALLSSLAVTGALSLMATADTAIRLGAFLAVVLVAGLIIVPRALGYVARFKSNETLLLVLMALCLGISLLAMKLGYSIALGAFLIGAVVAESRQGPRASELVEPVRDFFSAVFFVAVGMLINPLLLWEYIIPIAIITVIVIVGKVCSCSLGAFLGGAEPRNAVRSGMSLSQIGEFSFIIAALGESQNVTSDFLYPIAVAVSAITTLTTPYLIRSSDQFSGFLSAVMPAPVRAAARLYAESKPAQNWSDESAMVRKIMRRSLLMVGLNIILIAALFLTASMIELESQAWLPDLPEWTGGMRSVLWLVAVLATLPLYVASVRKLQAIAMIIAEHSIKGDMPQERKYARRSVLAATLSNAFSVGMAVVILLMSSALLPPLPVFVAMSVFLGFVMWRMWGHFVRVYAKGQVALRETLADTTTDGAHAPGPVKDALASAAVKTVVIAEGSRAAGRLLRELNLRQRTGASIIAIERNGEALINPSPHEEIMAGDHVVLLGVGEQLENGAALLGS